MEKATSRRNRFGCWGLTFLGLHLLGLASGVIDPLSSAATGTVTVHVWFAGWLLSYRLYGLDCDYVLFESAILLSALFQLAVGAAAFSRVYYGPLLGRDRDLFQELSVIGVRETAWIPPRVAEGMVESLRSRFTGLGWWACEVADVAVHQGPFVFLCRVLARESRGWSRVTASVARLWHVSMIAGPLHRILWDFSTCGESFCDGPYRGFLLPIRKREQFLWHLLPCMAIVAFSILSNASKDQSATGPGSKRSEKIK